MLAFESVIALFLIVLTGYAARKTGLIEEKGLRTLTSLVLFIATPAIAIEKMQREPTAELIRDLMVTFFLGTAIMLVCGAVGYLLFKGAQNHRRMAAAHLCMLSNCGFMGYPVVLALLGEDAMILAVMFNASFNVLAWTIGVLLLNSGRKISLRKVLLTPALIGSALGLIFFLARIKLPAILHDPMETLGSLTTPLSMLVIGARMVGQSPRGFIDRRLWLLSGLRLIVFPAATFYIAGWIGAPTAVQIVVTLLVAMPNATVSAMQAEHYGTDGSFATNSVALSTALSMLTIPLLCSVLGLGT
ncbi:MAG: AEC family transporter [Oscillospiraceae bacterium]|jgi:predicted permease|nr:AEC family transporter [Oscillospiraceae bacterium]